MKTSRVSLFVLVGSLAGAAPLAHAEQPPERISPLREAVFAKLDLTPAQKAQLKDLHRRNAPHEREMREQLRALGGQFADRLRGDASDEELRTLQSQVANKREELTAYRFAGLLEVRKLLTPEQRRRFADLYLQFRKDRAEHAAGE